MKTQKLSILTFFIFFLSFHFLNAQSSIVKKDEIINTNVSDFLSNHSEFTEDDFYILSQDVFSYFGLTDEYSTQLKKTNFIKSNEYKVLSDSLIKLKNDFKKSLKYIYLKGVDVNGESEYNMKAGGFYFDTQSSYFTHVLQPKNTYEGDDDIKIKFLNLNTVIKNERQSDYDKLTRIPPTPEQHIFIPCSTKIGELIENSSSYPQVYIFFTPNSILHNKQVDSYTSTVYNFKYEYVDYLNVTVKRIIVAVDDKIVINKVYQ
jgi:hypothetical protein